MGDTRVLMRESLKNDVDLEVSIGDYVISGGELAAMVLIDSVSRRLPNVLGNKDSLNDSFVNNLLDYPTIQGQKVLMEI